MFRSILLLFARRADTVLAQCHLAGLMDLPPEASVDYVGRGEPQPVAPAIEHVEALKRAA